MSSNPSLRYNISSWKQLPKCLSNKSDMLHARVGEYTNDDLHGIRLLVEHELYGTLFCCLVNAHGNLLSKNSENVIHELTPAQIVCELEKFGFLVTYNPTSELSGDQIEFLMTVNKLKFDKIRMLSTWKIVHGVKQFTERVVAFLSSENPYWLNVNYAPAETEYIESVKCGNAFDLSALSESQKFNWSWLRGFVANIDDVISDYANNERKDV